MLWAVVRKASVRAGGILLLFAASYFLLGRLPGAATWVFLGVVTAAVTACGAWRELKSKKPPVP